MAAGAEDELFPCDVEEFRLCEVYYLNDSGDEASSCLTSSDKEGSETFLTQKQALTARLILSTKLQSYKT